MDNLGPQYEEIGVNSAPARAQSKLAKRYLDQELSVLTQQRLEAGAGSVSKAQVEAMASPEYREALNKMSKVIATGEIALSKMHAIDLQHEYQRSHSSLEKAKIKML